MMQDTGDSGQDLVLAATDLIALLLREEWWQDLLVLPELEVGSAAQKWVCVGSVFTNESRGHR